AAVPGSEKSPVSESEIPIVMGDPVGLPDAAPPDVLAAPPDDDEPPAGVFDFPELQPATSSTAAATTAVETIGTRRRRSDVCNRLCGTIETSTGVCGAGARYGDGPSAAAPSRGVAMSTR